MPACACVLAGAWSCRDYAALEKSLRRELEVQMQECERIKVEAANLRDELATSQALVYPPTLPHHHHPLLVFLSLLSNIASF